MRKNKIIVKTVPSNIEQARLMGFKEGIDAAVKLKSRENADAAGFIILVAFGLGLSLYNQIRKNKLMSKKTYEDDIMAGLKQAAEKKDDDIQVNDDFETMREES